MPTPIRLFQTTPLFPVIEHTIVPSVPRANYGYREAHDRTINNSWSGRNCGPTRVNFIHWLIWGIIQISLISVALRFSSWRIIVYLQSITPIFGLISLLIVISAMITRNTSLVVASLIQLVWIGILLSEQAKQQRERNIPDAPELFGDFRVAHSNLLYSNVTPEDALDDVFSTDADLIAFSEITLRLHTHAERHELAFKWPHRIHDLHEGPRGIALWSKMPLAESSIEKMHDCNAVGATVQITQEIFVRILAIHPMAPISRQKIRDWAPSLHSIGTALSQSVHPGIAIGDYNATHWHAPMRQLYRRGLHSAHLRVGRLFAGTFPVSRRLRPFVSLDHALVTENIVVHEVTHVQVRGSDHRGIVIRVSVR